MIGFFHGAFCVINMQITLVVLRKPSVDKFFEVFCSMPILLGMHIALYRQIVTDRKGIAVCILRRINQ